MKPNTPPPLPEGWVTANVLRKETGLAETVWEKFLREAAKQEALLLADAQNLSVEAAIEATDAGIRKPRKGPSAFATSPEIAEHAQQLYREARMPDSWKSVAARAKEQGIDSRTLINRTQKQIDVLADDIADALGTVAEEAHGLIEGNLAGTYLTERGRDVPASSPEMDRIMQEKYPHKQKEHPRINTTDDPSQTPQR